MNAMVMCSVCGGAYNDFEILQPNSSQRSGGCVPDAFYAQQECRECGDQFGFSVPIVSRDGKLTAHLSCEIEAEVRS